MCVIIITLSGYSPIFILVCAPKGAWEFVFMQSKKFKGKGLAINVEKNIIMEDVANHFMGTESVGGWLYLTSEEIVFKSHNMNNQKHETVISLKQIAEVKTVLTAGFVPNGLKIITISGIVEKFVVNKRKIWIQKINAAILSSC
ncbi:MAG TPA: hypothetical protein DEF89_20860 [Desulfosporosinus sp.]|nr:hypothetical protein [Desulfosporosinus sp.]